MENVDKEYRFATYSSFRIEDEKAAYMLHFGNYSGTAGDGIKEVNNMGFSTKDKRFEKSASHCINIKKGGWWYSDCGWSDPNGVNLPGPANGNRFYMNWHPWTEYDSLLTIEIKLRSEKK
ncbi:Techylectin-5A like protein [Argiope bruennichi]|uniref:Techylectin-5A like protein n=1 Tax=Argiope bruennichi TaxID=94029 RepID=A0A8T0FE00_ARGBR|nr:Techylectin-5A like protein [Argiope bruennichi]